MLFSSLVFLYSFLPIVIIANFLIRKEYRNRLLLISSLLFFAWGGVSYTIILIASLIWNYFVGLLIENYKGTNKARWTLGIGVCVNLLVLGVFKYADFTIENLNYINKLFGWAPIEEPGIILPLGISFYTFQAISYIIDVYRSDAHVQRNIFKLSLYISFFPQLIAGPIVRYQLIEEQLSKRKNHFTNLSVGIQRFILGLSKKVLLANQFGMVADKVYAQPIEQLNSLTVLFGAVSYAFQIYYDFSGYSDMAIGLGRMFGFKLPENFNFPYMAKSVREFWTRWHMTLSGWFKNYLYIPLGGNRGTVMRTIVNLLIVFFATSIWHGASWNFVVWGMAHGVFMMLERLGLEKLLRKGGAVVQRFYLISFVMLTWVFFRVENIGQAFDLMKVLFSFDFKGVHENVLPLISNKIYGVVLFIGVLSATHFWEKVLQYLNNAVEYIHNSKLRLLYTSAGQLLLGTLVVIGLLVCTAMLVSDTYNPFIYFRF